MAYRVRKRYVRYGGWPAGLKNGTSVSEPAYAGLHSCIDEVHPGPPYKTGGPLLVTKKMINLDRSRPFFSRAYFGPLSSYDGHMTVLPYIPSPEPIPLSLSGWGAKGWNRAFPVHPIYNLGVSLIELKDLPSMLVQTQRFFSGMRGLSFSLSHGSVGGLFSSLKSGTSEAAGDYLNLQFGWIPFLQDLAFLLEMQAKLARKIAWLKKHNGKTVRRNFEMDAGGFSEDVPRVVQPFTTLSPVLNTELYSGSVVATASIPVQKTYDRRIWFSSKWRFFIPELVKPGMSLTPLKLALSGIDLDPSIIYKVIPWTWLLDWFVSVSALFQNIYFRARYHVVAEYAYVMCRENFTWVAPGYADFNIGQQYVAPPFVLTWPSTRRISGASTTYYEFRQREEANPYGFGITFASLSAYQWSILVALGLSRGKHSRAPRP